jgi:hypothetical protein
VPAAPAAPGAVSAEPQWSERAALDECRAGLKAANQGLPTAPKYRRLRLVCTSLIADDACRAALRARLEANQSEVGVAGECADRYCPSLRLQLAELCPDDCRQQVAVQQAELCGSPLPSAGTALSRAYAQLRAAMLAHDFGTKWGGEALELFMEISQYALSVPPPSLPIEPHFRIVVSLEHGDAFAVTGSGVNASGRGLSDLAHKVPRAADDRASVWILANPGADFRSVTGAIDVLHELGYERIQFGPPR